MKANLFESIGRGNVFTVADFDNLRWQLKDISKTATVDDSRSTIDITITTTTDKMVPISSYDVLTQKVLVRMNGHPVTNYISAGRANGKTAYTKYANGRFISPFAIKKVIFNDPATIILWADGTKTVVKAQNGEIYDPEKGFAMAISKRALGDQGNYYETFKKWVPKEEPMEGTISIGKELYNAVIEDFVANIMDKYGKESDAE